MPGLTESMREKLSDIGDRILLLVIVLLPWQARFIQELGFLGNAPWEQATRSIHAVEILLLAAIILHILSREKRERQDLVRPPAFLMFWSLLLIFALISIIWAPSGDAAMNAWVHLIEGFALAYLIWTSKLRIKAVLAAFLIGSAANAFLGLWQFLTQSSFASTLLGIAAHPASQAGVSVIETGAGRFLRAYGLLPHPNVFGGYMAIALLIAVGLAIRTETKRTEQFLYGAIALFVLALTVSFSRAAWLAYAATFLIFVFARRSVQKPEEKAGMKKALVLQVAVGILAFAVAAPLIMTRVSANQRLERISVDERGLAAYHAIELSKRHYAAGVGIGNMPLAAYREIPPFRDGHAYQPAHHIPLLVAAELGFFGFMVLLGAVLAWIGDAKRMFRKAEHAYVKMIALMPVALIVISFFDHYLFTQFAGTLLAGLVFGVFLKAGKVD